MKKKILIAFGTRPEALKFAPLVKALEASGQFRPIVCLTGQHREMLDQVVRFFKIKVDLDLKLMDSNQTLESLSAKVVTKFSEALKRFKPDLVFVQGDTTTAFIAALAGFYQGVPIAHLEAGLRTHDKRQPFPEEMNRVLISRLSDFHFTPTNLATQALLREGVQKRSIFQVGNPIVDTVEMAKPLIKKNYPVFKNINPHNRILFVTAHRRESFGKGLQGIFSALRSIAAHFSDVEIVYPVHLNPNVQTPAQKILGGIKRVHLLRPLTYEEKCWIMKHCRFILTDSGGIQEEAPSFKKPVLVLRKVTERPEGVGAGIAKVVGVDQDEISKAAKALLTSQNAYQKMVAKRNPYGDGACARRIVSVLRKSRFDQRL